MLGLDWIRQAAEVNTVARQRFDIKLNGDYNIVDYTGLQEAA